jgi:uncharacterized phosphosugar-binding protein
MNTYLMRVVEHLHSLNTPEQQAAVDVAAERVADKICEDELVHIYGPGGHSNLSSQEIFFRAGGVVNVSAILDAGTLLSNGALRSMHAERMPGYGRLVIEDNRLRADDLLILVNSYGINATLIDAAITAQELGVQTIGVSSRVHAESIPKEHPARHPSRQNLHDVVDLHLDTKVTVGDALLAIEGVEERVAAVSTFANAFLLQSLMATATALVCERGVRPTIWTSANAPDGDARNAWFIEHYKHRVRWL